MKRFPLHHIQLRSLISLLKLAPPEYETELLNKYRVYDLSELNSTDYDDIIDTVRDFINKTRFEIFNQG
jgi:hypothetical protein